MYGAVFSTGIFIRGVLLDQAKGTPFHSQIAIGRSYVGDEDCTPGLLFAPHIQCYGLLRSPITIMPNKHE